MRFKKWIAILLSLGATTALAAHLNDRAIYQTDVKSVSGISVFRFPTSLPTASRVCTFNADSEPVASTVTSTTLGFLDISSSLTTLLSGKQSTLSFINSITNSAGNVSLVGDSGAPGNSKYYGTDGTGSRGYYALPTSAVWGSITGTLSNQTDLQTSLNGKVTSVTASSPLASSGGTTPNITIQDAAADGTTKGTATFTAADFNSASGVISIDYTNGQSATSSVKGFLTSADWTTFNGKQAAGNYITALTGDVTASGPGSVAATIAANAVTSAKFRQGTALSVVGNATNGTANVTDIAAGADARVLRRSGTTIGFGAIDLSSANAVANVLANANTTGNAATGANTLALRDANGVVELQVKNPINTQSGTSYTLVAGDNGKIIKFTSGSAITLTIPAGLGAAFNCMVEQDGGGLITFTASSTTLHQAHSLTKTFGQYSVVTLVATAADVFVMSGDMQ